MWDMMAVGCGTSRKNIKYISGNFASDRGNQGFYERGDTTRIERAVMG
jgi:hypothetical protein